MTRLPPPPIYSLFDANGDKAFIVYKTKMVLSEAERMAMVRRKEPFEVDVVVVLISLITRIQN